MSDDSELVDVSGVSLTADTDIDEDVPPSNDDEVSVPTEASGEEVASSDGSTVGAIDVRLADEASSSVEDVTSSIGAVDDDSIA